MVFWKVRRFWKGRAEHWRNGELGLEKCKIQFEIGHDLLEEKGLFWSRAVPSGLGGGGAGRGDSCPPEIWQSDYNALRSVISAPPPPPPPVIRENTSALTSCSKIARYGAVEALENIRFLLGVRLGTVWGKSAMTDLVAREAGLAEFFRHQLASNHVIPAQVR